VSSNSWVEYLTVFNEIHNSTLVTSIGTVEVSVNEEFDPNGLPKNFTDKYQR